MRAETVIVGGGLTGLSLAHRLHEAGLDYLVLEARDRLGGRILSEASPAAGGSKARYDLGPSWFWPGQPRIARLVRRFELEVFTQYCQGRLVYQAADGQVRRDLELSTMAGSLRVAGGLGRLVDAVAGELEPEAVRTSHEVIRIERDAPGFRVVGRSPQGAFTIDARQLVLTAPPRVVAETIDISPPLGPEATQALRAIPTWMAGHAKLIAVYDRPFWRELGLSGDGISQRGPLMEIHDASLQPADRGALFGFVGLPGGSPARERAALIPSAVEQLAAMFGPQAGQPTDVLLKDWATDRQTATAADEGLTQHPEYGMPPALRAYAADGLVFAATELGSQFGGFLEGALEASELAFDALVDP